MRFLKFTIKNYKGIKECSINVDTNKPRVFPLIGLNETGKTTILEAINLFFSKDIDVENIAETADYQKDKISFIPKLEKMSFTGKTEIIANFSFSESEIQDLQQIIKEKGYELEQTKDLNKVTTYSSVCFQYENSSFVQNYQDFDTPFKVKKLKGRGKKEYIKLYEDDDVWSSYCNFIKNNLPLICYFPTFSFTIPEKIYLTPTEGEGYSNFYYRQLIQEVLFHINQKFTIQQNILEHFNNSNQKWSVFSQSPEFDIINQILQKISQAMTEVIINSWSKISPKITKKINEKQVRVNIFYDDDKEAVYLRLALLESYQEYTINERSLGFRWFFCFWLFTYFKVHGSQRNGNVFLFDEPASNLHAHAQQQILENIISLANDKNIVIFSTHNHYLLNPSLIEKTYVIRNQSIDSSDIDLNNNVGASITALPYRQFVASYPSQKSYFLPLLEVLNYVPSTFEFNQPSLLVEGKTDFFFFSLILSNIKKNFTIIPGTGASTFNPILSILFGWGQRAIVLLDADKEGKLNQIKYLKDHFNTDKQCVKILSDFDKHFKNKSLEDIILEFYKKDIEVKFNHKINDKQDKQLIQLYISECYQQSKIDQSYSFDVKSELRPFVTALEAWIQEKLS